jgi:hypothetical protein
MLAPPELFQHRVSQWFFIFMLQANLDEPRQWFHAPNTLHQKQLA